MKKIFEQYKEQFAPLSLKDIKWIRNKKYLLDLEKLKIDEHFSIVESKIYLHFYFGDFFLISHNEIAYFTNKSLNKKEIELLYTFLYPALLYLNNILPFHSSAVALNGKSYLFCADSGVGKSTLAFASQNFLNATILCDDISPVQIGKKINVIKNTTVVNLNNESLFFFKLKKSVNNEHKKKVLIDIKNQSENKLKAIFILSRSSNKKMTVKEIKGNKKFQTINNQLFRIRYYNSIPELKIRLFPLLVNLSRMIPVYELCLSDQNSIVDTLKFFTHVLDKEY
ncbi:MAG: hypothetical protein HYU67_12385 [Flavobacteriia bacterium]|nr:hypothetical protein [Flavobacteriia bacterium]